jgi:hypothetical protein
MNGSPEGRTRQWRATKVQVLRCAQDDNFTTAQVLRCAQDDKFTTAQVLRCAQDDKPSQSPCKYIAPSARSYKP